MFFRCPNNRRTVWSNPQASSGDYSGMNGWKSEVAWRPEGKERSGFVFFVKEVSGRVREVLSFKSVWTMAAEREQSGSPHTRTSKTPQTGFFKRLLHLREEHLFSLLLVFAESASRVSFHNVESLNKRLQSFKNSLQKEQGFTAHHVM